MMSETNNEDPVNTTDRSQPIPDDGETASAESATENERRPQDEVAAGAQHDNFCIDDDSDEEGSVGPSAKSAVLHDTKPANEASSPSTHDDVSESNKDRESPSRRESPLPARIAPKLNPTANKPPRLKKSSFASSPTKITTQQQIKAPQSQDSNDWQPFAEDSPLPSTSLQKPSLDRTSSTPTDLSSLRRLFDTEYERAILHQEISWKARYTATRISFLLSCLSMILYLWMGCLFYRSEAGWNVPDALLFTVYTVTTVGYGGPRPLPNTAAFHAFTSVYVLLGISGVTVLGAHTYQLIMLEATRIRGSPLKNRRDKNNCRQGEKEEEDGFDNDNEEVMERFRRQFMNELEDRVKKQPALDRALDALIQKGKEIRHYMVTTRSGRVLAVMLPFVGMILLGAVVVGLIEGWTPLGE